LQRRQPGIGAQDEDAIKARRLGQLAGVDLEDRLARCRSGLAQVTAVTGIADQRLVAALELGIKGRNDKPFVWTKTAEVIPKLDRLPVSSLCFKH